MHLLIFNDNFDGSLGDVSDNKTYVLLLVNSSRSAQTRDFNMENVANFNIMQLSASPKSDKDNP